MLMLVDVEEKLARTLENIGNNASLMESNLEEIMRIVIHSGSDNNFELRRTLRTFGILVQTVAKDPPKKIELETFIQELCK